MDRVLVEVVDGDGAEGVEADAQLDAHDLAARAELVPERRREVQTRRRRRGRARALGVDRLVAARVRDRAAHVRGQRQLADARERGGQLGALERHAHAPAARADELDELDGELVADLQHLALAQAPRRSRERLPLAARELLEQQQLDRAAARPARAQAARHDPGGVGDHEIGRVEQ